MRAAQLENFDKSFRSCLHSLSATSLWQSRTSQLNPCLDARNINSKPPSFLDRCCTMNRNLEHTIVHRPLRHDVPEQSALCSLVLVLGIANIGASLSMPMLKRKGVNGRIVLPRRNRGNYTAPIFNIGACVERATSRHIRQDEISGTLPFNFSSLCLLTLTNFHCNTKYSVKSIKQKGLGVP